MTRLAQIQKAVRHLPPTELQELRHWLLEEGIPEMLAAADEGLRSLVEEPTLPVTALRRKIEAWTAR